MDIDKEAVYEDEDGQRWTYLEVISEMILQKIYNEGEVAKAEPRLDVITSPYSQLLFIECFIPDFKNYSSLARALRKEAKKWKKCIACKKKVAKPCFTLNMDDISYIRKRKHQMGTGKGDLHLNKHSPKMKQINEIINLFGTYNLNTIQKDNIKNQFKDLRPELLTLITGKLNINNEKDTNLQRCLGVGLIPLLPEREKIFFKGKDTKPPKYGSKIDIKDYLTFWNYASKLNDLNLLKEEEMLWDDVRFHIFHMLGFDIPLPCEKDTDYWEQWR